MGIALKEAHLNELTKFYVVAEDHHFIFHVYRAHFDSAPEISLSLDEHTEYKWCTIDEGLKLDLIHGGAEVLKMCYALISSWNISH